METVSNAAEVASAALSPRTDEVMIPMRDGVRLQTFVMRLPGPGPFPTLLTRCTYGHELHRANADRFVAAGYAVALQNIRGRLGSEGEPPGTDPTAEDGYDTIDWLTQQDWCNGRIGTFGASADAQTQTATAFLAHPAHVAMSPVVLPFGMNSHFGGAYLFSQIPQWFYLSHSRAAVKAVDQIDWMPHLAQLPAADVLSEIGEAAGPAHEAIAREGYFRDRAPGKRFADLRTATRLLTGWYDHCASGSFDFHTLTQRHGTPAQRANTRLIVGPWNHGPQLGPQAEYDFGPDAQRDHLAEDIAFFDHYLKDAPAASPPAPVTIFVMGRNVWRDEIEWPLSRAVPTPFYLHGDGGVRGPWRRGGLSLEPPEVEHPDEFDYDPARPVPTWGGATSGPARVLPGGLGPRDQRIVLYRDDVLTYYSEPLTAPLEATGELMMVLYAASSAVDTDFTVKLMDVRPDGNARLISDGIVRARYRNGFDDPHLLIPGAIEKYEIDLWFTSNEFQPGHRIAIAISSSNFPRFNRNLNTGGDNELDTDYVTAHQTIYHDADHPSHLILPVIPPAGH